MMDNGILVAVGTQTIAYGIALFKVYTDMQLKIKELEMRINSCEKVDDDVHATLGRVEKFMHESNTRVERMITEVRLELRDKMDRP